MSEPQESKELSPLPCKVRELVEAQPLNNLAALSTASGPRPGADGYGLDRVAAFNNEQMDERHGW
jgi:hypothetical protein